MRTIFAFQCEVTPHAGQADRDLFEALIAEGSAWVRDNARDADGLPPDSAGGLPAVSTDEDRFGLFTERHSADGQECSLSAFTYPDETDPSVAWALWYAVRLGERGVALAAWLTYFAERFAVRPGPMRVVALPLVPLLVRKYRCRINEQPVPAAPRRLVASDVARFVRNQLFSPRRSLPVVMLAPHPLCASPLLAAEPLQEQMLGFAEVVSLADRDAAARLARELGVLAPPEGGVRLYWPGLSAESDLKEHPYRTLESIEKGAAEGEPGDLGLSAILFQAATDRFSPLKFGGGDQADPVDARQRQKAAAELERLRAEADRLRRQHALMSSELANARVELASCREALARATAAPPRRSRGKRRSGLADVAAALAKAAEDFSDVLVVWQTAAEAAGRSESPHAAAVYRALSAIADLARVMFRDGPEAAGPLDQAFAARVPFKYTSHESATTLGLFGQQRVFHHHGRSLQMQRHLTLARGDRKGCVQIYFEFDPRERRAHIGYCGNHLPIARRAT